MRRLTFLPFLLILFSLWSIFFLPTNHAFATCSPLPSDKGQSTGTITVSESSTYTLWVRMWAPTTDSNSVFVQIDNQCPVNVNDAKTSNGFLWANFSDGKQTQSITYTLTAGNHTITLAGREAGAGVDRVLLANDPKCIPVGTGDNCLGTTTEPTKQQSQVSAKSAVAHHSPNWWVIIICLIIILIAAIYIIRRYRLFMKSLTDTPQQPGVVAGGILHEQTTLPQRLVHFMEHHKVIVAIWAVVTLAAISVGIVAATGNQPVFEAEAGKLSGEATIAANTSAAGGKYVVFQINPVGQNSGGSNNTGGNGGGKTTPGGGGSNNGGSSSGGSGQTGGGGDTAPSACALPKYPNTSCTGVPTGTSYKKTISGEYYANTPGEVIDSWHITGDLVIQATGIVIKNSLIDGHVDNDSLPLNTSFTIVDSTVGPATCDTQGWPSLNAHDFTATRVFLRGHQDGIDVVGNNATVTDSFVQPCYQPPEVVGSDGFHSDGVQDQCGGVCTHMTFVHNTFDSQAFYKGQRTGNSAIYLGSPYNGTGQNAGDVILQNNLFLGGGYTTALWWDAVGDQANWIISGNAWVQPTWSYGPTDSANTCSHQTWVGNSIVTVNASYAVTSTVGPLSCIN